MLANIVFMSSYAAAVAASICGGTATADALAALSFFGVRRLGAVPSFLAFISAFAST